MISGVAMETWTVTHLVAVIPLAKVVLLSSGMFVRAVYSGSCTIVVVKVAFIAGSSKQGNALRASVGSNFVVTSFLSSEQTRCQSK